MRRRRIRVPGPGFRGPGAQTGVIMRSSLFASSASPIAWSTATSASSWTCRSVAKTKLPTMSSTSRPKPANAVWP